MNIQVRVRGLNDTMNLLKRELSDVSSFLPAVAEVVAGAIEENFQRSGRYNGTSDFFGGGTQQWKTLSSTTIEQRKRKGYVPVNILRQTGQLASSVTVTPAGASITISSNKAYAAIHQFGGTIKQSIRISDRMRKYFWARYFSTGEERFKWMALTKKQVINRTIRVPARPFITLTEGDIQEIQDTIVDALKLKYE